MMEVWTDLKPVQDRREKERRLLSCMVAYYCRKNHGNRVRLCPECADVDRFIRQRCHCPRQEATRLCRSCPAQCGRPELKEKLRRMVRYACPRMLFRHPVTVSRYVAAARREKKAEKIQAG